MQVLLLHGGDTFCSFSTQLTRSETSTTNDTHIWGLPFLLTYPTVAPLFNLNNHSEPQRSPQNNSDSHISFEQLLHQWYSGYKITQIKLRTLTFTVFSNPVWQADAHVAFITRRASASVLTWFTRARINDCCTQSKSLFQYILCNIHNYTFRSSHASNSTQLNGLFYQGRQLKTHGSRSWLRSSHQDNRTCIHRCHHLNKYHRSGTECSRMDREELQQSCCFSSQLFIAILFVLINQQLIQARVDNYSAKPLFI